MLGEKIPPEMGGRFGVLSGTISGTCCVPTLRPYFLDASPKVGFFYVCMFAQKRADFACEKWFRNTGAIRRGDRAQPFWILALK